MAISVEIWVNEKTARTTSSSRQIVEKGYFSRQFFILLELKYDF